VRFRPLARRGLLLPVVGLTLVALLAAGSYGAPLAAGQVARSSPAASRSAIKADWEAFFSSKTPVARRVKLLQDGNSFAKIIKAQAASPLASAAGVKVTKVVLVSSSRAKVTYSIVVGGVPALSNQAGVAVFQGGIWKIGVASFCGLLAVENGGKTSSLPAACRAAK
jgi:hypothetical protein